MGGFHVRRNGVSIAVTDLTALRALARSGGLSARDEVRSGNGEWLPAGSMAELAELLGTPASGDPWSAWKDVEAVDAASLYREVTEQGVEDLPAEALTPVGATPAPTGASVAEPPVDDLLSLPDDALSAADDATEAATPRLDRSTDPAGQIIDFPRAAPRGQAPPPMMPDFARRERPGRSFGASSPERSTSARTIRSVYMLVGTVALVGLGAVFLGAGPDVVAELDAAASVRPAEPARTVEPAADDPLRKALALTEAELRGRMPPVPRRIEEPGALGDALMLEMTQLGVNVTSVDARVMKYTGRKQDQPKTVEVRVSYVPGARTVAGDAVASQAASARDVGAIALVVGRYVRVYRLEVPILELTDMSTLSKGILPSTQAEAWYLGRVPLPKLVESMQRL